MGKQQTAVEWFILKMCIRGLLPQQEIVECYEQAKEMEKEQIEDAFWAGKWNCVQWTENREGLKDPTEYYNEKYAE